MPIVVRPKATLFHYVLTAMSRMAWIAAVVGVVTALVPLRCEPWLLRFYLTLAFVFVVLARPRLALPKTVLVGQGRPLKVQGARGFQIQARLVDTTIRESDRTGSDRPLR